MAAHESPRTTKLYDRTGDEITLDVRVSRIAQLLYGGADGPLGLVSRQNYLLRQVQDQHRKVQTGNSSPADFEDSVIATLGCVTPLASTREAIRKNWENLRYTNLIFTDLSYSQLYEADLHGSRLDGAYLRGANLRCANLSGANLDKAAIDHSTDTTLVNTYLTMGEPNLPLRQTISLPDEEWLRWKKVGKFKMSVLKKLLGPTFPNWANSFDENVCAQG